MLNLLQESPLFFVVYLIGLLVAITIHEFAHAFTADRLGDPTPRSQNRLNLNPLSHLDPLGTLSMLLVGFGWGKPVEFDPYNLERPRRDAALISIAGPVSNLLLALILSIIAKMLIGTTIFAGLLYPVIVVNVSLAIFNLVPIGPLDGQKIVFGLLPRDLAYEFQAIMNRYGTLILIFFILPFFGGEAPIHNLIGPVISFILRVLT